MRTSTLVLLSLVCGCAAPSPDIGERSQANVLPGQSFVYTRVLGWNGNSGDMSRYTLDTWVEKTSADARAWKFQYQAYGSAVASAVFQVSLFRPKGNLNEWTTTPGLVLQDGVGALPAGTGTGYFTIDFTRFPRATTSSTTTTGGIVRNAIIPIGPGPVPPPLGPTYGKIPNTDPVELWVRVVALDASGAAIGTPSQPVHVLYGTRPPPAPIDLAGAHPWPYLYQLTPVHAAAPDYQYHFVVTQDVKFFGSILWHLGDKVTIHPSSSSWFDDLCSFVGSVVSWVKNAWDWIASEYSDIKEKVAEAVATALGCGDACKGIIEGAIDAGLAAVGLPPTLPDFDQLVAQGEDYLVAEMAEETGLPEDECRQIAEKTVAVAKATADHGGDSSSFLKPDTDFTYRSGLLKVALYNNSATTTPAGSMDLVESGSTPRFAPIHVRYPSLAPYTGIWVPIVLQPMIDPYAWTNQYQSCFDTSSEPLPGRIVTCMTAQTAANSAWASLYTTGKSTWEVKTSVAGGGFGSQYDHGAIAVDLTSTHAFYTGLPR